MSTSATAEEAITSADGYAARDVLSFREAINDITPAQHTRLTAIQTRPALGLGFYLTRPANNWSPPPEPWPRYT